MRVEIRVAEQKRIHQHRLSRARKSQHRLVPGRLPASEERVREDAALAIAEEQERRLIPRGQAKDHRQIADVLACDEVGAQAELSVPRQTRQLGKNPIVALFENLAAIEHLELRCHLGRPIFDLGERRALNEHHEIPIVGTRAFGSHGSKEVLRFSAVLGALPVSLGKRRCKVREPSNATAQRRKVETAECLRNRQWKANLVLQPREDIGDRRRWRNLPG